MSSRIKTDVKKLFEFWCEVALVHNGDKRSTPTGASQTTPSCVIVESFPEGYRDEKTMADIPAFAFPCKIESDSVQSYSFVLTTDDSKWRFGFCRHDPKTDTAMVIITSLPWHDTFLRLLTLLAELRRCDDTTTTGINNANDDFSTFLAEAYNRGVPDPGGHLKLFYNGGQNYFVFERPLQFQLPSIPENHNLNLYYNFVDPKNMIAVFAAMLAERRIIFTSRRLDRLSSCIQAANAFLYPMVWQHIFIPVLPMKLKDYLSAPMPYLIGVPQIVLETMTPDELGEVVILNCDTKVFQSPFDDVREMPADIVSQMKKQLSHSHEHIGDRVSKIFLGVLVQLISGYRDAVEFRETGKTFNRDKFIESRPKHLRPFLAKMMELQIFQQFIDERLQMLNTGLGYSDEFELETARYAEKMKKRRHYEFLNNVKEKTNPAVKSAVKSVKEGSRGVKSAYKDFKSKLRDITPPNSSQTHFRSHLTSNSQHDRIDGNSIGGSSSGSAFGVGFGYGKTKSIGGHHSAPSSPIFSNKRNAAASVTGGNQSSTAASFQYACPEDLHGSNQFVRRAPPLAMSSSSAHIQSNGFASITHGTAHLAAHLAPSPTVSPASSLCSSEMNLSQELQNHPLFKPPLVDRSLKPSMSLDSTTHQTHPQHHYNHQHSHHYQQSQITSNHHHQHDQQRPQSQQQQNQLQQQYQYHQRLTATRTGGPPPARPPPPAAHLLQTLSAGPTLSSTPNATVSYYNHPQVRRQLTALTLHPYVETKPPPVPQPPAKEEEQLAAAMPQTATRTSTPNKIVTTDSIYDNPPDMQSPPIPPRRQCTGDNASCDAESAFIETRATPAPPSGGTVVGGGGSNAIAMAAAAVHAGLQRLEHNCWQDYAERNLLQHDALRHSSSSNASNASVSSSSFDSSGGSFVSAASSSFFHSARSGDDDSTRTTVTAAAAPTASAETTPVPAPRQKKESLRSLQPQHLPVPEYTLKSAAPSTTSSQEDTLNDLISLDDSNNTSFDLEDFDPLNQNARPLPLRNGNVTAHKAKTNGLKSTTLPANTNTYGNTSTASTVSNPLYPYHTPQHLRAPHMRAQPQTRALQAPTVKPPPLPTSKPPPMPAPDEDFELLRKYGLDQFTLTTTAANVIGSSSSSKGGANTTAIAGGGMHNWTTFD
uniref:DENN domain-containing protein 1A n=1 Tax=Zeugodacus cucurbitae TaxID=28588 RepID=A0A0A1XIL1_ZEUCU